MGTSRGIPSGRPPGPGTSREPSGTILGTERGHPGAMPGTSPGSETIPGTERGHPETILGPLREPRLAPEPFPGPSWGHQGTLRAPGPPWVHPGAIPGPPVPGTSSSPAAAEPRRRLLEKLRTSREAEGRAAQGLSWAAEVLPFPCCFRGSITGYPELQGAALGYPTGGFAPGVSPLQRLRAAREGRGGAESAANPQTRSRRELPEPSFGSCLASKTSAQPPGRASSILSSCPSVPLPEPWHAEGFPAPSRFPAGFSSSEIPFPSRISRLQVLAKRRKRDGGCSPAAVCTHFTRGVTITHGRWQRSGHV
ncbi:hypothetical protein Nmel_013754 [Mimus melanotis]